jgi:hypothetical protein
MLSSTYNDMYSTIFTDGDSVYLLYLLYIHRKGTGVVTVLPKSISTVRGARVLKYNGCF